MVVYCIALDLLLLFRCNIVVLFVCGVRCMAHRDVSLTSLPRSVLSSPCLTSFECNASYGHCLCLSLLSGVFSSYYLAPSEYNDGLFCLYFLCTMLRRV